jgi:hypothetical protein
LPENINKQNYVFLPIFLGSSPIGLKGGNIQTGKIDNGSSMCYKTFKVQTNRCFFEMKSHKP